MTYSFPSATIASTFYYFGPGSSSVASMECQWYISGPPAEHILLTWLDLDLSSASSVDVYDYPSFNGEYYDVNPFMYFDSYNLIPRNINISSHVSNNSGLLLYYKDQSVYPGRRGLNFTVSLRGRLLDVSLISRYSFLFHYV